MSSSHDIFNTSGRFEKDPKISANPPSINLSNPMLTVHNSPNKISIGVYPTATEPVQQQNHYKQSASYVVSNNFKNDHPSLARHTQNNNNNINNINNNKIKDVRLPEIDKKIIYITTGYESPPNHFLQQAPQPPHHQYSDNYSPQKIKVLQEQSQLKQSHIVNNKIKPTRLPFANDNRISVCSSDVTLINVPVEKPQSSYDNNSQASDVIQRSLILSTTAVESPAEQPAATSTPGRYVCPYCQLNCTKPSVLQKHIRAHTNERPYPCLPCGFAFKTRSNLYKHCRSRAHALRLQGAEPQPEDETSLGSDPDQEQEISSSASSDVVSICYFLIVI